MDQKVRDLDLMFESGSVQNKERSYNIVVWGHLNPLVQTLPSYIKNTTHLLNKLKDLDVLPANAILVTLDVPSLYTNIPPTRALMHVENSWINELKNLFLLNLFAI